MHRDVMTNAETWSAGACAGAQDAGARRSRGPYRRSYTRDQLQAALAFVSGAATCGQATEAALKQFNAENDCSIPIRSFRDARKSLLNAGHAPGDPLPPRLSGQPPLLLPEEKKQVVSLINQWYVEARLPVTMDWLRVRLGQFVDDSGRARGHRSKCNER